MIANVTGAAMPMPPKKEGVVPEGGLVTQDRDAQGFVMFCQEKSAQVSKVCQK